MLNACPQLNVHGKDMKRVKRFSPVVAGIGALAVSQVAQLIGTAYLDGKVSRLETRVEPLNADFVSFIDKFDSIPLTKLDNAPNLV